MRNWSRLIFSRPTLGAFWQVCEVEVPYYRLGEGGGSQRRQLRQREVAMTNKYEKSRLTRRAMLRGAAVASMLGPIFKATEGSVSAQESVNRNSAPSGLKITDMRACRLATNYDYPLIKIYTNQDVYGLGEVRDAGVEGIALVLKAHLLGQNPLNIEGNLRRLREFAGHGQWAAATARWKALDVIAGKVYGVPAYRLLGQKRHDRIRIYADTTAHPDLKVYAERMRKRQQMGLTFFKMDLETDLVKDRPGAVNDRGVATDKGLEYLCEFIAAIRDVIGWSAPLAADHFGPLNVQDSIRYARAFERYQLAWAEDILQIGEGNHYPWQNWRAYKMITDRARRRSIPARTSSGWKKASSRSWITAP